MKTILQTKKFTDKDRMIFYKQLTIIMHSGLPLLKGIQFMSHRLDKNLYNICAELQINLAKGCSLTQSMQQVKHFFTDLGITLISAGEESGRLEEVAMELAKFYETQYELKKYVFKAALYPMFIVITAGCVLVFFMFYVVPVLSSTYLSMHIKPHGLLAYILKLQSFINSHKILITLLFTLCLICIFQAKNIIIDLLMKIPILRKLYYLVLEIRFCKLMSLLLNSGISVMSAVNITLKVIHDKKCRRKLLLFHERLHKGSDISSASTSLADWLNPLSLNLIRVGAATGYLPQMLNEAASIGEQDLQNRLDRLKEIISPLLLLLAALITALVVSSIVGPLFNLVSALPENT